MGEAQLLRLIGDEARPLKLRAHGWGGTVLRSGGPARSVSRETTFGSDVRDPDELETMLLLFVTRVSAQLRDEQLMARTVTLKLRHDDFTTVTRSATLREATDVDRDLFDAVRPLFVAAFAAVRQRNRGVRLIGVSATNLTRASAPDLFEAPERAKLRQLSRAVDQVREKFGDDAVGPAGILGLKQALSREALLPDASLQCRGIPEVPRLEAQPHHARRPVHLRAKPFESCHTAIRQDRPDTAVSEQGVESERHTHRAGRHAAAAGLLRRRADVEPDRERLASRVGDIWQEDGRHAAVGARFQAKAALARVERLAALQVRAGSLALSRSRPDCIPAHRQRRRPRNAPGTRVAGCDATLVLGTEHDADRYRQPVHHDAVARFGWRSSQGP